ncbi:MAG: folate family ECF transporter S component [Clostridia bacterium]|nr:folate family ECF transporter S component [Clostridia bacterium]
MSNLLAVQAFDFSAIFGNIVESWYLYVAMAGCFLVLALFFVFFKTNVRAKLTRTQRICHIGIFTAICTVVNCFSFFPTSYISISLLATVCAVAGFLYGPRDGFIIGFTGDLLQAIIMPAGAYNPLIGIASGLMAVIPALVLNKKSGNLYMKIAISSLICLIVCTSGLNTFGLWLVYGMGKKTFLAYLFVRLPFQILVSAGNAVISILIIRLLPKILSRSRFNF